MDFSEKELFLLHIFVKFTSDKKEGKSVSSSIFDHNKSLFHTEQKYPEFFSPRGNQLLVG